MIVNNERDDIGLSYEERKYLNLYFSSRGYIKANKLQRIKFFFLTKKNSLKLLLRKLTFF